MAATVALQLGFKHLHLCLTLPLSRAATLHKTRSTTYRKSEILWKDRSIFIVVTQNDGKWQTLLVISPTDSHFLSFHKITYNQSDFNIHIAWKAQDKAVMKRMYSAKGKTDRFKDHYRFFVQVLISWQQSIENLDPVVSNFNKASTCHQTFIN